MSRVPYKFTAIRTDDDDSGKNVVPFATVTAKDEAGAPANVYDASTGGSPYSSFILDSNGTKQIWVEDPGIYQFSIGGGDYFSVFISSGTTEIFTEAEKAKLSGISSGATANATNDELRDRTTHTGFQAISTISGLQSELNSKASGAQVSLLELEIDTKLDKTSVKANISSPNTADAASTLAVADALANANKGQNYKGLWNSLTNTPVIVSSTGVTGDFYDIGVPSDGVTTIDGIDEWPEGSKIIFNGSIWEKNTSPGVRSVDGRTGAVILNFDTPAQAALASLPVGTKYSTKGANAVGDGGHGDFIVSDTALTTEDGYSCYELAGGTFGNLRPVNGQVTPEQFGAAGDGATDDTAACQRAIDFYGALSLLLKSKYRLTGPLFITRDGYSIIGLGWFTGFVGNTDFGSSIIVESPDPLAVTIFRVALSNFEIARTSLATSGSLLRMTEAAYCTVDRVSLQNGFIGFHGQGLRACFIDGVHIRSGAYFTELQAGSRFALFEDSPSGAAFAETTETLVSDFNCTTNSPNAYVEYGVEIKEADGIWFDSGHVRGAALANGYINGASSPQLLGAKFDNFWFDGLTAKCLLIAGSPVGYMGFLQFNDCSFTGGSLRAIEIQLGTVIDWVEFNSCNVWSINSQTPIRFDAGANIHVSNLNMKALNLSNAASSSAMVVGAAVNSININGGNLFNSPNIANGISINDGVVNATVNNFTFKSLGATAKPVNIANKYTLNYQSSGCSTDQAARYVSGNMQRGRFDSVADDAAVSVSIGEILGGVLSVAITLNTTASGIIALETFDPATIAIIAGGANLAVTTGVLTGTTGTDGRFTVSVTDDGTLYFENRTGVARSIIWRFIDRDI